MGQKVYTFFGAHGSERLMPTLFGAGNLGTPEHWYTFFEDTPGGREQFEHECRMMARVRGTSHAAALEDQGRLVVASGGCREERPALKMPYYRGKTMDALLRSPLPPDSGVAEVMTFCSQILAALAELELRGILHNDIQPRNVLRSTEGEYLLIDFGNAVEASGPKDPYVKGRENYIAPEKPSGQYGVGSDIYSFGVLLGQFLLCLDRGGARYPSALKEIAVRCTRREPAARYQHFADVSRDVGEVGRRIREADERKEKKNARRDRVPASPRENAPERIPGHGGKAGLVMGFSPRMAFSRVLGLLAAVTIAVSAGVAGMGMYMLVRHGDDPETLVDGKVSFRKDCETVWGDIRTTIK